LDVDLGWVPFLLGVMKCNGLHLLKFNARVMLYKLDLYIVNCLNGLCDR
jgi:hypothetical protein